MKQSKNCIVWFTQYSDCKKLCFTYCMLFAVFKEGWALKLCIWEVQVLCIFMEIAWKYAIWSHFVDASNVSVGKHSRTF